MNCGAVFRLAAVLALTMIAQGVRAQAYPTQPVKLIHGFAPGGGADVVSRLIGGELSKLLGQPFVIEARPGAGSTLAADAVARAQPNGYTLYVPLSTHPISAALFKTLPYDPVESFEFISTIYDFPMMVVVRSDSPHQTMRLLLDAAKAKPEAISYGTSGIGTPTHLIGELMSRMAGVQMLHVPYKGEVPAVTGLLGGEIPLALVSPNGAIPHIKAGKLKGIAVTSDTRWSGMPEIPTVDESGIGGFDVRSWLGLAAPAGTARAIVQQLNTTVQRVLQTPEVRARLESLGGEVRGSTPEEMRARVVTDLQRWKKVVAEAAIPKQ